MYTEQGEDLIMDKISKEDLEKNMKVNCGDYNSMVTIAALYKKLYGEFPKIGMSGAQAEFAQDLYDALPERME